MRELHHGDHGVDLHVPNDRRYVVCVPLLPSSTGLRKLMNFADGHYEQASSL